MKLQKQSIFVPVSTEDELSEILQRYAARESDYTLAVDNSIQFIQSITNQQ